MLASQLVGVEPGLWQFLLNFVLFFLYMAGMAAVAVAAADPGGVEHSPAECLRVAFSRIPGYLALACIVFLVTIAVTIPFGIGFALMGVTGRTNSGAFIILIIALSVAVLWICLIFCLTVQAMVVEELGPLAALRRSKDLTCGNRLKIFAALFLIWLLPAIILAWFSYDAASSGEILAPSIQFVAFTSILYSIINIMCFSLLAIVYTNCASISESSRVNDYSQVF
jgi:hypothetical protein